MNKYQLNNEEQELSDSLETNEWESVANVKDEISTHQVIAKNTLRKDKRINIRLSSNDLEALKTNAVELGLPYQTLVSSVLHQYATNRLHAK
ncbi:Conserved domain protein [uncultured Candidatus Thioglobus sp.]|nr:Conserved domain protein [uncultured Candidatus Thioglobus sp.]